MTEEDNTVTRAAFVAATEEAAAISMRAVMRAALQIVREAESLTSNQAAFWRKLDQRTRRLPVMHAHGQPVTGVQDLDTMARTFCVDLFTNPTTLAANAALRRAP